LLVRHVFGFLKGAFFNPFTTDDERASLVNLLRFTFFFFFFFFFSFFFFLFINLLPLAVFRHFKLPPLSTRT